MEQPSFEQFRIISKLGQGAYSTVYKVQRIQDHQFYALKYVKLINLSDKQRQNALNQVRILASIKHPNIISFKQTFIHKKSLWYENFNSIVMQFADQGDLYQKICSLKKKGMYVQQNFIWNILVQIAAGLKQLHKYKILHRDLKVIFNYQSANVFLFNNGRAKLGDLNVSKIAKQGMLNTQTGTPYYASPQVWRDQPYNQKSDIWSFGCVIYQLTTLKPPFRGQDMQSLYKKVIKGIYPKIPNIYSKDLSRILQKMLVVNAHSRPSNDQILMFISKKNKAMIEENVGYTQMLKTIKFSKKFGLLTERLPKSDYNSYSSLKNEEISLRILNLPLIDFQKIDKQKIKNRKQIVSNDKKKIFNSQDSQVLRLLMREENRKLKRQNEKILRQLQKGKYRQNLLKISSRNKRLLQSRQKIQQIKKAYNIQIQKKSRFSRDFSLPNI